MKIQKIKEWLKDQKINSNGILNWYVERKPTGEWISSIKDIKARQGGFINTFLNKK